MIGIESGKLFARAAFVRTTVVTIIPSPLQRLHGFGYNGIVRIHLSTWLVLQLEGSVHSVPRDVTLPSLDTFFGCTQKRCHVSPKMVKRDTPAFVFWAHSKAKMMKRDTGP